MKLAVPAVRLPGPVKTLLKMLILAAIIYLIVRKIDERLLLRAIGGASPGWIGWAIVWYTLSKILSAYRFNLLMRAEGVLLTAVQNLRLYWLCMYYNLLLPGGISGDGYKIKVLMDAFQKPLKRMVTVTLIDRITGVVALGQLGLLLIFMIPEVRGYWPWTIPAIGLSLVASRLLYRWAGKHLLPVWSRTTLQSLGVQGAQMIATWGLVVALGQESQWADYLILFLISSLVAMVPMTIGGAGARELTFLYGARFLGVYAEQAVAIAFLFYLIATAVALSGILFSFDRKAVALGAPSPGSDPPNAPHRYPRDPASDH